MGQQRMSTVYFSETDSRQEFVNKMLDIFKVNLHQAKRIFVKPNVVSYEPYPTTTHLEVLEAVLKRLSNCDVVVGDAPAIDAGRSDRILAKSALRKICENHGVKLLNLYSEKMKLVKSPRGYEIRVSALPASCDFVISLPVLKTHRTVGLSGALKNQFGYLSRRDRFLMHCKIKDLHKAIAEVNAAVPTNLFIVDAVEIMIRAQECRHGGCPANLGMMIAGADPVSLDLYGLQLLGKLETRFEEKNFRALKYIEYSSSCGLGSTEFKKERV